MMEQQESKLKAFATQYDGYTFRSRNEAKWAAFFKYMGIQYKYEDSDISDGRRRILPDFFLPDFDIFLEVKHNGFNEDERNVHIDKYSIVPNTVGKPCIIAYGDPKEVTTDKPWNNSVLLFNAVKKDTPPSLSEVVLAQCRVWFSSDDEAVIVSPNINQQYAVVVKNGGKWIKKPYIWVDNIYHRDVEKVALFVRQLQFEYVGDHPAPDSDEADEAIEAVWRSKHAPKAIYAGSDKQKSSLWGAPLWAH